MSCGIHLISQKNAQDIILKMSLKNIELRINEYTHQRHRQLRLDVGVTMDYVTALNTKGRQFDNFVAAGGNVSCHNDKVVKLTVFCFQCRRQLRVDVGVQFLSVKNIRLIHFMKTNYSNIDGILPKGPYPPIGPFWQDTLDIEF